MRKEYNNAVKKELDRVFLSAFPNFRTIKSPRPGVSLKFCRYQPDPGLTFFIYVWASRNNDEFNVEVAWSEDDNIPICNPFAQPQDLTTDHALCVRLTNFYDSGESQPWVVEPIPSIAEMMRQLTTFDIKESDPDVYLPRVPDLVADVVEKIQTYVIPFFKKVAAERGVEVDFGDSESKS